MGTNGLTRSLLKQLERPAERIPYEQQSCRAAPFCCCNKPPEQNICYKLIGQLHISTNMKRVRHVNIENSIQTAGFFLLWQQTT